MQLSILNSPSVKMMLILVLVFTPNRCDTVLGVPVRMDGTGFSASVSACTGASVLDVLQGAFKDIANNPVDAKSGISCGDQ